MAVTDVNGTQTATVGTEHTLADTTAAGVYVLSVALNNMVAGDTVELRIYKMPLTGGTAGTDMYLATRFFGAQSTEDEIAVSIPVSTPLSDTGAIRATLKQTTGTSRTYRWSLEKHV